MFDLITLIKTVGYVGLFGIVFAESGLFIGFFLPGDSLLFTAGFLAAQGYLSLPPVIVVCFLGAVLGDNFGYAFGKKVGPAIFRRDDSVLFHKDQLATAHAYYQRYGGKTIILARFLPVVRTFVPILAGVGDMHYPTFVIYNVVGGLLWAVGLPVLGFYLGNLIPNIDRYLVPIVASIIIISALPTSIHLLKEYQHRQNVKRKT
ncbi:DedA family protein [Candidatus Berkelbacteria bacterium]|nr:DedA family protein [Candidatus Berkelbacteria bacterium]